MGGQVLFKHYTHIMKLIAISALAGFAAAEQMLAGMHADSDECAGCEVAPEPVFKCFGEACSDVECALPEGYYADANNCRGYCFCSGEDAVDHFGNRIPSQYKMCPEGTVYSAGCSGFHEALAGGMGFA